MERIGNYYKLFTLIVNGIKYYFIGDKKAGGCQWVFRSSKQAVDMFEKLEKHSVKYPPTV